MKLRKSDIDKFIYQGDGKSRDIRWDDDHQGFGLRIYPSGKKSFVLSYSIRGRKRLLVLGRYGYMTLDQARVDVKIKIGEILKGVDPVAIRHSTLNKCTVKELCSVFMEKHSKVHKKSWSEDQRRIDDKIIPIIGDLRVSLVKRTDIARLHSEIGKISIYEANRTVALMRTMFEIGRNEGLLDEMSVNPAKGIKFYKEKKRDRWITPQEIPALFQAIENESDIYVRAAIKLYLYTGMRKSELLKSKWSNVDFNRKTLKLEDTKAGNNHIVPLSGAAIDILQELPRQLDNPYIIVGHKNGRGLVNISKPWIRIRKKAGLEDVRLHDLRRTVGSWMAQCGVGLQIIGKVLNHASTETTKIYARIGDDSTREVMEDHSQKILETISNIQSPA